MLSIILPRWEEKTVVDYTKELIAKELSALPDAEIIVADSWSKGLDKAKCDFVCLIEPDCLVSSGYFTSNYNLFKKNSQFRKLAMVTSSVGLNNWGNRIFGYTLEQVQYGDGKKGISTKDWEIQPTREKKSSSLFPIQVGFLPGAIIRKSAMQDILSHVQNIDNQDLAKLSIDASFYLWGSGRRVHVNPNTTYVSTDKLIASPAQFNYELPDTAQAIFTQEVI